MTGPKSSLPSLNITRLNSQNLGVQVSKTGSYKVQILQLNGQLIEEKSLTMEQGMNSVNIDLPNSAMIVRVEGMGFVKSKKFIQLVGLLRLRL